MKDFLFIIDDRNRVCLSRILGHPYINASFIEVRFDFFIFKYRLKYY
jgi:hypothetical protein